MLFKMSEDKIATNTVETNVPPTVIVEGTSGSPDTHRSARRVSKKAVVITVACVFCVGLMVTGALVGIRLYFDGKIEEQKYSMTVNGVLQNVTTSNNFVTYHTKTNGVESWIVQDFEKELQTIKYQTGNSVGCIVTALNRSLAATPDVISSWAATTVNSNMSSQSVTYRIVSEAISDNTFLGSKASEMCQNIPTYHAARSCTDEQSTSTGVASRQKRATGVLIIACCSCGCVAIIVVMR